MSAYYIYTVSGGESPNKPITSHVTAIVIVLVLVMAVILVVPLVIGFAYYLKKRNMLAISYSVDRSPSISSSHFSGKNDDTPDLVQCRNGRRQVDIIDLKAPESLEDESEILFEQSGEIRREDFAAHVETFDAKRQLLFQEEFDVRMIGGGGGGRGGGDDRREGGEKSGRRYDGEVG